MNINDQVISDPYSGLVIKFENGVMTIWADAIPMGNRDFFFNSDGSFDGTGTGCNLCPIKPQFDEP